MGVKVRGTPACFAFGSDNFDGIWAGIVVKTQQEGFEAFRGVFLVALGEWGPLSTIDESMEGTWERLASQWDREMDMNYIPAETFEVRMVIQFSLSISLLFAVVCVIEGNIYMLSNWDPNPHFTTYPHLRLPNSQNPFLPRPNLSPSLNLH
jgi:hypothetical protein